MGLCPKPRPLFLKKRGKNNILPPHIPLTSFVRYTAAFFNFIGFWLEFYFYKLKQSRLEKCRSEFCGRSITRIYWALPKTRTRNFYGALPKTHMSFLWGSAQNSHEEFLWGSAPNPAHFFKKSGGKIIFYRRISHSLRSCDIRRLFLILLDFCSRLNFKNYSSQSRRITVPTYAGGCEPLQISQRSK